MYGKRLWCGRVTGAARGALDGRSRESVCPGGGRSGGHAGAGRPPRRSVRAGRGSFRPGLAFWRICGSEGERERGAFSRVARVLRDKTFGVDMHIMECRVRAQRNRDRPESFLLLALRRVSSSAMFECTL